MINLLRKIHFIFFGAGCLCVILFFPFSFCNGAGITAANKYIQNGGYALARNGNIIRSANKDSSFIPASTIKLVTSLAALKILGPDYRFHTRFYLDNKQNLFIQGFGDPFLISEKVDTIAGLIAENGITEIRHIILDDHAFALEHTTDGSENSSRSYDAGPSALAVNFNSMPIKVIHRAKIKSPESQTPYLPLMGKIGRNLTSGYHRVNTDAFAQSQSFPNGLLYAGQLFQAYLLRHGVSVNGTIKRGHVPDNTRPLLDFQSSETISEHVKSLLRSSSNFMANQLYLTLGVKEYGFPATWEKSRLVMKDFIHWDLQLTDKQITMVEGSGLSSKNKVTPSTMIRILEYFREYAFLVPIKYGTRMKSGTLRDSGVYCYAGYIPNGNVSDTFVILLNQKRNRRDKILKILYRQ